MEVHQGQVSPVRTITNGIRIDDRWNTSTLAEVIDGLKMFHVWWGMAWFDIMIRYRRSVLGPLWITLSLGLFIGSMGLVYSTLFKMPLTQYLPHLTVGMIVWNYISVCISESCVVFIEGDPIIRNTRLPLSVFVFRMAVRNLFVLAHNIPVMFVVLLACGTKISFAILFLPVAIFLLWLNTCWLGLGLGMLATRYRDVAQLIGNLMTIILFITPVMWNPEMMAGRMYLVDYNIIFHFVEIVRAPALGNMPQQFTVAMVLGTTVVGWLIVLSVFHRLRGRVAYWL